MKISTEKEDSSLSQMSGMERKIKSLWVQIVLMGVALIAYIKIGGICLFCILGYFCANSCCILLMILLMASTSKKKKKPESLRTPPQQTVKSEAKPVEKESYKKLDINFQLSFRKKNKPIIPPKQIVIKKYEEYVEEFKLTKQLEKEFKTWVHRNVLLPTLNEPVLPMSRTKTPKSLTRMEINDLKMMCGNGFMCYDKNNELHSKALFKVFYNYFNEKMPEDSSYYTNPMDEFIFDDISKIKISRYGLLVEDVESLIEGKKTFNVYFINKNTLYDTQGDVILSFLILLIFANRNEGRYLGAFSLRGLPFLSK
ncbi:hypothetical protein NEPAR06_0365 [Nematocida parisii]|uniref:Uncharacterized protein n=1 Tax=Nematocida parisii (strain ERTm3) TaxID=935791 RepID=I3EG81_NEMP3|nr:uncharacterized protein NEPG_01277 [Nematocida parisii ERTm1]EIJ88228.1 hypothetical protein NEQG_01672 [Nematocida parisii ERTm3]KAI5142352.1 hypothetical protein NEPAR07_0094 [Nematocida parisii]EIJ93705.1 hypothetical protein NEPG_01277 [Nematocida parisii ERTm1]KAI5153329.1 hypothetical protein NEPAR06_0365 [Nematocida parisii]KAI5155709.1 hypothetical protein NEPAR05_0080 [Nematocida parisii]|eukprot:XP_013059105.1 hypothetical protein NEPG_01277 [Nematocida parisii ERTm1]